MSSFELIVILCFSTAIWYWLDGVRSKEIAISIGASACKNHDVYFLDQTVVLSKIRLRRNSAGHIVIYREYQFEFTSDGEHRYQGNISLLGKQAIKSDLGIYRPNQLNDNSIEDNSLL